MALNCRSIRRFGNPGVEVFALSSLEEEDIVAGVEIGELVELVEFGFRVEFCVLSGVRE